MKKTMLILFFAIVALNSLPVTARPAATHAYTASASKEGEKLTQQEARQMMERLDEIRSMKITSLSASQKQHIRKELLNMKERATDPAGGIYISAGALIVIIILLIIFR